MIPAPAGRVQGLLSGVVFFQSLALLMGVFMVIPHFFWAQAWFVEKTMLDDTICWYGEGIWFTNEIWGDNKELHCDANKPALLHHNARSEYCEEKTSASYFDPLDFDSLCFVTKYGQVLQILALGANLISLLVSGRVHFTTSTEVAYNRSRLAMLFTCFSLAFYLAVFGLVSTSPLFSREHAQALGSQNQVNYRDMGCVFQSPFVGNPLHVLEMAPLKCIYPGPAMLCTLGVCVLQIMAILSLLAHSRHHFYFIAATMEQAGANGKLPLAHYSLHAAFVRKLGDYHRFQQYGVALLIPSLCLGNGLLFLSWFYHGMQFLVFVHVYVLHQPFLVLREQIFSFDPVSTLTDFWQGGGYVVALVTLVFLYLFPFVKILVWIYVWFIPMTETRRGRLLSWVAYLGRWSLISLYGLCVITLGFMFARKLNIVGLVEVEIELIVAKGPGITWFLVALVWTVLLGNGFVYLHSFAKAWQDQNAAAGVGEDNNNNSVPQSLVEVQSLSQCATFRPLLIHNESYTCSRVGRIVVMVAIALTVLILVVSLPLPLVEYQRTGAVPLYLIQKEVQNETASILDLLDWIKGMGGKQDPAYSLQTCFAIFAILVPLLHSLGLFVLFFYPFSLVGQRRWFRLMEFLDSWNALDVFLMAVVMAWVGFESISRSVVKQVVPGLTLVVEAVVQEEDMFVVSPRLRVAFYLVAIVVVLEKTLTHVLMELSAVSLANRQRAVSSSLSAEEVMDEEHENENMMLLFSPAVRYVVIGDQASSSAVFAGVPRRVWRFAIERLGIMQKV